MTQETPNNNPPLQSVDQMTPVVEQFKGYTLDELRYNRALIALKSEFCKEKILVDLDATKRQSIIGKLQSGQGTGIFKSGVFSKMARSLNYIDYILVGIATFRTIRSITSLFRRKQ